VVLCSAGSHALVISCGGAEILIFGHFCGD
jgi:hypothetical protein